jgi:hypothetical protein
MQSDRVSDTSTGGQLSSADHSSPAEGVGRNQVRRVNNRAILIRFCHLLDRHNCRMRTKGAGLRSRALSAVRAQRLLFAGAKEGSEVAGEGCC